MRHHFSQLLLYQDQFSLAHKKDPIDPIRSQLASQHPAFHRSLIPQSIYCVFTFVSESPPHFEPSNLMFFAWRNNSIARSPLLLSGSITLCQAAVLQARDVLALVQRLHIYFQRCTFILIGYAPKYQTFTFALVALRSISSTAPFLVPFREQIGKDQLSSRLATAYSS